MAKNPKNEHPLLSWAEQLLSKAKELPAYDEPVSERQIKTARQKLTRASEHLIELASDLDPIRQPQAVFDPANPKIIGRIVGLALLAQPQLPLNSIEGFYGSGIYSIYYTGSFDAYAPLSGKDHPIYVGKADPETQHARTPFEQGEKLAGRLREHTKSISKATNLNPEDFLCRFLVVSSGWQEAAERHLISLYRPIWNKETKICYGIGKHGDSPSTRKNSRSPWDTLHSGRTWATDTINDQIPEVRIREMLLEHFSAYPLYNSRDEAIEAFLQEMTQMT